MNFSSFTSSQANSQRASNTLNKRECVHMRRAEMISGRGILSSPLNFFFSVSVSLTFCSLSQGQKYCFYIYYLLINGVVFIIPLWC